MLAKPAMPPGAAWANQLKVKQRELLTQHNAEMEAWRGMVTVMDTHLRQGRIDLYAAKLPYDRVTVYENFMLITQVECEMLDKMSITMKEALSELKALEQHCHVAVERRLFYKDANRKLREVATHLLKFTEIMQYGSKSGLASSQRSAAGRDAGGPAQVYPGMKQEK